MFHDFFLCGEMYFSKKVFVLVLARIGHSRYIVHHSNLRRKAITQRVVHPKQSYEDFIYQSTHIFYVRKHLRD